MNVGDLRSRIVVIAHEPMVVLFANLLLDHRAHFLHRSGSMRRLAHHFFGRLTQGTIETELRSMRRTLARVGAVPMRCIRKKSGSPSHIMLSPDLRRRLS